MLMIRSLLIVKIKKEVRYTAGVIPVICR